MDALLSELELGCEKIHVSSMWTMLERNALISLMFKKQKEFSDEEERLFSSAPIDRDCLRSVVVKRNSLENRISVLMNPQTTEAMLEANRRNFEDFITS